MPRAAVAGTGDGGPPAAAAAPQMRRRTPVPCFTVAMSEQRPVVVRNREADRFEVEQDGHLAVLEYQVVRKSFLLVHTGVPPELEGRGIGSALARAALDFVRRTRLTAVPLCPFVRAYIRRHPEYLELVGFGERGDRLC